MLKIKGLRDIYGSRIHPTLIEVLKIAEAQGFDVITSGMRDNDTGVHGTDPLRGIDLRCRDAAHGYAAAEIINSVFVYDPERPDKDCALYHDVGHGAHLHIQVHPNTVGR